MKVKITYTQLGLLLAIVAIGGVAVVLSGKARDEGLVNGRNGAVSVTENRSDSNQQVREIRVTARQWEFDPNPIKVKLGEKVRLIVKSEDVTHGMAIPEFGINEVLPPGKEVVIEFQATKKGTFPFFCSVACGEGHAGMRGSLVVTD